MNYQISSLEPRSVRYPTAPFKGESREYIVAAHQPNFFPHLGYFHKLMESDLFVIRDEVLFSKRGFQHRNKIRAEGKDGSIWIAAPVKNTNNYIKDVLIKQDAKRGKRHWRDQLIYDITSSYEDAPYFDKFFPGLKKIIQKPVPTLAEFNMGVIQYLAKSFGIETPMIMASSLELKSENYEKSDPSKDLADICTKVGATTYLSGQGGRNYLDFKFFEDEGVEVDFQEFFHPRYPQNHDGFIENMSAIDALFCLGRLPYIQNEPTKHPRIKSVSN